MKVEENTASCLGRSITFGPLRLPASIKSFFSPEMTHLQKQGTELLSAPIQLLVEGAEGETVSFSSSMSDCVLQSEGTLLWKTKARTAAIDLEINTRMEFDGVLEYEFLLRVNKELAFNDVKLQIPIRRQLARYTMGLGQKGGKRPQQLDWKWEEQKNQDSVWIGDVNAGIQVALKDINYERPLNTNFYLLKPLRLPPSWHNEGRGGIRLQETDEETFLITAYSGKRKVRPGG